MDNRLYAIAEIYSLKKSGNRFSGPCPKCGGSSTTDRFCLYDDGGFHCFSCGWSGDAVAWLRQINGLSCKEAHDQLGQGCSNSCPVYASCRGGEPVKRQARPVAPKPAANQAVVPSVTPRTPAEVWQAWATGLVEQAKRGLAHEPEVLHWLAGRGIDAAAAQRFGLGWRTHDQQVLRKAIGLSPERDGKPKLWVPGGLVIPIFNEQGRMLQLRIRRTEEARARFLADRKYQMVEGGGNEPIVLGPRSGYRGVVVVEAELDCMACAANHGGVLVIGLRSVANGLPAWLRALCVAAPIVLVALDADPAKDGKPGPGSKAVRNWLASFANAKYWPVPTGKDPGEYAQAGGDLHAWIDAGLPPVVATDKESLSVAPAAPVFQDVSPSADSSPRGEGGEYTVLTLADGREIVLADTRELWVERVVAGDIVFSSNELERVKACCAAMDEAERQAALDLIIDAKAVFSGYVYRGDALV